MLGGFYGEKQEPRVVKCCEKEEKRGQGVEAILLEIQSLWRTTHKHSSPLPSRLTSHTALLLSPSCDRSALSEVSGKKNMYAHT